MMDRRELASKFVSESKKIMGASLDKAILYGSCARGEENVNSDIDIFFLTTLPENAIRPIENELFDLAFDFEMDYAVPISVIVKNTYFYRDWVNVLPFYMNIEKEGIILNE